MHQQLLGEGAAHVGAAITVQAGNAWDIGPARAIVSAAAGNDAGIRATGADPNVGMTLETKGAGGMSVNTGFGTIFQVAPSGGAVTQGAYPMLYSAPAGGNPQITSSSGYLILNAATNVLLGKLPTCDAAPSGYACRASTTAGAAVSVK